MNKQFTTVSAHQVGVMAAILLFTLKMTSLPAFMYEYNKTGALLNIFTFIVLDFLLLLLLVLLKKKFPNDSLYNILKSHIGVVFTKIFYFVFFLFFIFKILSIFSDGFTFIKDVVDEEFDIILLFICLIPVAAAMAHSGIRNIARTTEFFYPIALVCVGVIFIFSFFPVNSYELGNIFRAGAGKYFEAIFRMSFWTGDLFVFFLFFDKIQIKKKEEKKIFIPFTVMSVLAMALYVVYFFIYQETSVFHTNLICDILQYAIGTTNGWHMDLFAIILFAINIYIQTAIMMYCASESLKKLLNYENSAILLTFINILVVIVEFLFLTDYLKYITFAKDILCYFSAVTILGIPLILMILLFIKGKKYEKNKS